MIPPKMEPELGHAARWLMDGNWCQHRAAVNTGPDYQSGEPTPYLYTMPGEFSRSLTEGEDRSRTFWPLDELK